MTRDKGKGVRIDDEDMPKKGKRNRSRQIRVSLRTNRGSGVKGDRLDKKGVKHKGKRVLGYVVVPSDSDFESDFESSKQSSDYSDDPIEASEGEEYERGRKDMKHKRLRPKNRFEGVQIDRKQSYYRSNIRTTFTELQPVRFTEQHFNELKKTPFYLLLISFLRNGSESMFNNCMKIEDDIRDIVRMFDEESECFIVGSKELKITREDADLVFGIVSGEEKISLRGDKYTHPEWIKRCFREELVMKPPNFPLYRPIFLNKIEEMVELTDTESIQDVCRLLCCYVLGGILCPVRSGALSWYMTSYLEDFNAMCKYDWSAFFVLNLINSLKRSKDMKVGGCAMLLPYRLCEHTSLVHPVDRKAFPRFLKWDLNELNGAIFNGRLHRYTKVYPEKLTAESWEVVQYDELAAVRSTKDSPPVESNAGNMTDASVNSSGAVAGQTTSESIGRGKTVVDESSVRRFEVGSSSKDDTAKFDKGPSFDLGFDSSMRDANEFEDTVMKVCSDLNKTILDGDNTQDGYVPVDVGHNEGVNFNVDSARAGEKDDVGRRSEIEDMRLEIKLLKEQMQNERVRNQLEILQKTDVINHLESEIALLRREVEMVRAPTPTQLFEDEAVIKQIDEIEKQAVERFSAGKALYDKFLKIVSNEGPWGGKDTDEENTTDVVVHRTSKNVDVNTVVIADEIAMDYNASKGNTASASAHVLGSNNSQNIEPSPAVAASVSIRMPLSNIVLTDVSSPRVEDGNAVKSHPTSKVKVENEESETHFISSMAKRVKGRTRAATRKPVQMSPQPLTQDLMKVHEIDDSDGDDATAAANKNRVKHPVKNPFDNRLGTVKNCQQELKDGIYKKLVENGESQVIFIGNGPLTHVTVGMVISLLNNRCLDNEVIDAWSELIHLRLFQTHPSARKVTTFTLSCWVLIQKREISKQKNFGVLIERPLEDAVDKDFLLFPVNITESGARTRSNVTGHWTLLKLDIKKNQWTFFNSLRPRTAGSNDPYLKNAMLVVKYVDAKLKHVLRKRAPHHPFLKRSLTKPIESNIMQQVEGSLDCGVIVCSLIESFHRGVVNNSAIFDGGRASEMRVRIAGAFEDPFRYVAE